jgi:hypothetical protein
VNVCRVILATGAQLALRLLVRQAVKWQWDIITTPSRIIPALTCWDRALMAPLATLLAPRRMKTGASNARRVNGVQALPLLLFPLPCEVIAPLGTSAPQELQQRRNIPVLRARTSL